MMPSLEAIYVGGQWCSPVVGTFVPCMSETALNQRVIGCIRHFGRLYSLIIPGCEGRIRCLLVHETPVDYGTPVAVQENVENVDACQSASSRHEDVSQFHVLAPCDGFLRTHDVSGRPIRAQGELVSHGMLLAIIEVMKLGIDILYEGDACAEFVAYRACATVKKGDVICTLKRHIKTESPVDAGPRVSPSA